MRGRKPKPTKLQIAEGDPRRKGVHRLDQKLESEPKATRGLPSCPRHLKGRARAAWNFWSKELELMDLDHRPDAQMLEGACVNYARAVKADLQLDREGLTIEESTIKDGEKIVLKVRRHPAVVISSQAWQLARSFCSEFGLSPVSRQRLAVDREGQKKMDELQELLNQPRLPRATTTTQTVQ